MPFKSRAQQGYMHAASERGDLPESVVNKFDRATSHKQFERLPGHAKHADGGNVECPSCGHSFAAGGEVPDVEAERSNTDLPEYQLPVYRGEPQPADERNRGERDEESTRYEFARALKRQRGYR